MNHKRKERKAMHIDQIAACYLYDISPEDAEQIDKEYGDWMHNGPYFAQHEGREFLIDVEDMPNEVRASIERGYCDTVESGLSIELKTVEDYIQAQVFLDWNTDFRSCIVQYDGKRKLLIEPTIQFLIEVFMERLSLLQL
jgi:hypothetical protein